MGLAEQAAFTLDFDYHPNSDVRRPELGIGSSRTPDAVLRRVQQPT